MHSPLKPNRDGLLLLAVVALLSLSSHTASANQSVSLHFGPDGDFFCNGKMIASGDSCQYQQNLITLTSSTWSGSAEIHADSPTVTGSCAGFVISGKGAGFCGGEGTETTSCNLAPNCAGAPGPEPSSHPWPKTVGEPLLNEWFSDIPWHQKLGTFAGNTIDQPFMMPFAALPQRHENSCKADPAACILKYGVTNIIGMERTDTLVDSKDTRVDGCEDCVQVQMNISNFNTQGKNGALQAHPTGQEPPFTMPGTGFNHYYGGYVITDGSTYAPQLPWYMSHYCDADFPGSIDRQDTVCYGDYFTPMVNGFNAMNDPASPSTLPWKQNVPWSIFPYQTEPNPEGKLPPANHCKQGEPACSMVMAGFNLRAVEENDRQYPEENDQLIKWFNMALKHFQDNSRHFPWTPNQVTWKSLLNASRLSPFLGDYDYFVSQPNANPPLTTASNFYLPRRCRLDDLVSASESGSAESVKQLRRCAINYEFHHNGYLSQWKPEIINPSIHEMAQTNQYGRTSFLYAGIPGLHTPLSFKPLPAYGGSSQKYSISDKAYNSSIFSLYMPITNIADQESAMGGVYAGGQGGRNYDTQNFYHSLLMSNHMDQDPQTFANGLRGKALWHDEYRSNQLFERQEVTRTIDIAPDITFPASFDKTGANAPFHGHTCDSCHLRNGSGVPIKPNGRVDQELVRKGVTSEPYKVDKDYTFSNAIRPMKVVFFDLAPHSDKRYYTNKVMNVYGDSFQLQLNPDGPVDSYEWSYQPVDKKDLVVKTIRTNPESGITYRPVQPAFKSFKTRFDHRDQCSFAILPSDVRKHDWPESCADANGTAILKAINERRIGTMLLNGKRLGNSGPLEAIPETAIKVAQDNQHRLFGDDKLVGEAVLSPGMRDSKPETYKACNNTKDCYIARFGWIGDAASLEDQVANAARDEMNILSREGHEKLYSQTSTPQRPLRYNKLACGPADQQCQNSQANGDLIEQYISDMADYARWLGIPTRSEYQVSMDEVTEGEKVFSDVLQCHSCHVIKKIKLDPEDNMLPDIYRQRLRKLADSKGNSYPFISYLGTDLLLHDMGYLSQVNTTDNLRVNGIPKTEFKTFIQKIRTPPLKGLRFNRFVTDSHLNTAEGKPACDFLLHDGRACDAIEAAFLHDGPAIAKLGMIEKLNNLSARQVRSLRAFLYSL